MSTAAFVSSLSEFGPMTSDWQIEARRRQFRLGPVGLVVEAGVPFDLVSDWLPNTNIENDGQPAVAVSVVRASRPSQPTGTPIAYADRMHVWITDNGDRATILSASAHARLDLAGGLARVDPGADFRDAHRLLSLTCAMLLARFGAALIEASAAVDTTGWCWLALGAPADRARMTRAFCADGGRFVSDGIALLRRHPLKTDQLIVESWNHYPPSPAPDQVPVLPWDRWTPIAPLRGILLAHSSRGKPKWREADHDGVAEALSRSAPFLGLDEKADHALKQLLRTTATRRAFHAPLDPAAGIIDARPLTHLARAIEELVP